MDNFDWPVIYSSFLGLIIILVILMHDYLKRNFSYWTRKGIPQVNPTSYLYGNIKDFFYGRKYIGYILQNLYNQLEGHPCGGIYEFVNPVLMVREPELLQIIMVEKFNSFRDGRLPLDEHDFLSRNPFFQTGTKWRETRSLLSTGFTPAKIKYLDEVIKSVYQDVSEYIDKNINSDIEVKQLSRKYTCNVVAAWGWGINGDSFSHNSVIKNIFDKFEIKCVSSFVNNLRFLWPQIGFLLGKKSILSTELTDSLLNLTEQVIKKFDKNRNATLLDSLQQSRERYKNSGKEITFTTKDFTGYMISYYLDAYESAGNLTDLVIYQLMLNSEVQQKLRNEVSKLTDVTVDSVNKLEYMEMIIEETGRLHTLFPFLRRICTEKFRLGKSDIDVGTLIVIPSYAIHHDPIYYPNPNNFNPENFSQENKKKRHKFTYLPFGQGPRSCLGMKYSLTKVKLLLAYILKNYNILPPKNKPVVEQVNPIPHFRLFAPKEELYVQFQKIN